VVESYPLRPTAVWFHLRVFRMGGTGLYEESTTTTFIVGTGGPGIGTAQNPPPGWIKSQQSACRYRRTYVSAPWYEYYNEMGVKREYTVTVTLAFHRYSSTGLMGQANE